MAFDLVVFNKQVYTGLTETVDQKLDAFNEASNNALMLAPSSSNMGDYAMEASFKTISGLVRRRNVAASTAVTATNLAQLKKTSVKVAAGTPPIVFEPGQYRWILDSPERAAVIIADQLARAMLRDQLNTAINALVAAISTQTGAVNTITTTANIAALTSTAAKFGDRLASIAAWIVHSKVMNDIWQNALANSNQLFRFGDVAIMEDQFGRKFIMTDSPALMKAKSGDETADSYYTLGLVQQAALVEPNDDFDAVMVDGAGKENIQRTYQAEWSYNVGLYGYSWNTSTGGASPTDTALGTSANWSMVASSLKDTAGVMLKSA